VIAVLAINEAPLRAELADVLGAAGWEVHAATDREDALRLCRAFEADVLLVEEPSAIELLDSINHNAEMVPTGVVVVGDSLDVPIVTSALKRGAADVLRAPVDPADALARASAAARTKALVKQLTAHNHHIEGLVMFDELTGLRNRRAIMNQLELFVANASRHERPLSALMLDVDRFKEINDTHGHRAGDEVLNKIAHRVTSRLRTADVAGRIGGDEIMVLLPETDAEGAATLADSIRAEVAARPITTPEGPIDVTVSIGSASWDGEAAEVLRHRADQALYAAKAAGRDRSVAH
jgi:two-component system cell cycle response regulator